MAAIGLVVAFAATPLTLGFGAAGLGVRAVRGAGVGFAGTVDLARTPLTAGLAGVRGVAVNGFGLTSPLVAAIRQIVKISQYLY